MIESLPRPYPCRQKASFVRHPLGGPDCAAIQKAGDCRFRDADGHLSLGSPEIYEALPRDWWLCGSYLPESVPFTPEHDLSPEECLANAEFLDHLADRTKEPAVRHFYWYAARWYRAVYRLGCTAQTW